MTHPLDSWIKKLVEVRSGDLWALTIPDEHMLDIFSDGPAGFTDEQAILARSLYRPEQSKIEEMVVNWEWEHDEWMDDNQDEKTDRSIWTAPPESILAGSKLSYIEPETLLSIGFAIDGFCNSSSWCWEVLAVTEDLAVMTYWDDNYRYNENFPEPWGLVDRKNPILSSVLLFQNMEPEMSRFVQDGDGMGFWHEVGYGGMTRHELYKLLLAREGRGGKKLLSMSDEEVAAFRDEDMVRGFGDLMELDGEERE